jgi:glucose/arabinose dehydrogenase
MISRAMKPKFLALLAAALPCAAQQPTVAPAAGVLGKGAESVFAPAQCFAVEEKDADGKIQHVAERGILVRIADRWLCFDVEQRKVVAEWTKVTFDLSKTNFGTYKGLGTGAVVITGEPDPLVRPSTLTGAIWRGYYCYGEIVVLAGKIGEKPAFEVLSTKSSPKDPRDLIQGGPSNWPQTIPVRGTCGADDAPYVVDTIPLPDDNPWKCWLRPTGLDFFPDGRLALCTLGGDVWVASGLDDKLENVTWRRFAGGLREPTGLRIVDGKIIVGCRDQITRLHDLNGDGEADFYECVNAGRTLVPNFHAFAYDLQTDRAGNFYYGTGGNQLGENEPWHGKLYRVSPDGKKLDAVASGFRAPNGLTIGPDDSIYVAENQGQWIPSSKISRVKAGGFYGFVADPKAAPTAKAPPSFDPPLCYLPMTWDNSSGGGIFCESEKWGPYRGHMLHTSFGAAALFAVLEQRVGDVSQGGVVKFPLKPFDSGICRARFAPHDGQLYVCGLKGWQSRAVRDGCLARVRYTGRPVHQPTGLRFEKDAVVIEFSTPLDPVTAADAQNYAGEQWNYQWHSTYGSPDISPGDPKKRARDRVEITTAKLSSDGRTVTLAIPGLAPVMQMLIKMNIKAADGTAVETEIAGTVNVVPK